MTTLVDIFRGLDWITVVTTIKDRDALQVMQRLTVAQRTALEAQITQLKQVEEAIGSRMKSLK
jgi:hypothetical protein